MLNSDRGSNLTTFWHKHQLSSAYCSFSQVGSGLVALIAGLHSQLATQVPRPPLTSSLLLTLQRALVILAAAL